MKLFVLFGLLVLSGFAFAQFSGDPACLADKPHQCYNTCCSSVGGTPADSGDGSSCPGGSNNPNFELCIRQNCMPLALDCTDASPECKNVYSTCRHNCEVSGGPLVSCLQTCDEDAIQCSETIGKDGSPCCGPVLVLLAAGILLLKAR